jgi:chromosome segregation ATPase
VLKFAFAEYGQYPTTIDPVERLEEVKRQLEVAKTAIQKADAKHRDAINERRQRIKEAMNNYMDSLPRRQKAQEKISRDYGELEGMMEMMLDEFRRLENEKQVMTKRAKEKTASVVSEARSSDLEVC